MSNVEYQDFQTLETEIKDYAKQVETLGTEQKDHQEDLIKVQKTLLSFKSSKGFDRVADSKVIKHLETAIATRETDIETCKKNIDAVKQKMEVTQENLEKCIEQREQKDREMEQTKNSLKNPVKGLDAAIEQNKNDIEKRKRTTENIRKIKDYATAITAAAIGGQQIMEIVKQIKQVFGF